MPQMSPIWWLSLFIIFTITLILVTPLNYFNKTYCTSHSLASSTTFCSPCTWKW